MIRGPNQQPPRAKQAAHGSVNRVRRQKVKSSQNSENQAPQKLIGFLTQPRTNRDDKNLFERVKRKKCDLNHIAHKFIKVEVLNANRIYTLLHHCESMEHQLIKLRDEIILKDIDYQRRKEFTSHFLWCLSRHHGTFYEGILFGSTVSGLGFRDSDVDLRLRPLAHMVDDIYEPVMIDDVTLHRILKNIANTTTVCTPTSAVYIPSTKVPIAKMNFLPMRINFRLTQNLPLKKLEDGLKYDVSISSTNPLASLNSKLLRFLCHLSPKFHLLATALRYWSKVHLIVFAGRLSSYALVNMIIFFCQSLSKPLLPTVDQMRDRYFAHKQCNNSLFGKPLSAKQSKLKALTKLEWQCIICTHASQYRASTNQEPVSVILFKFFEFYLKFPYTTHVITIRTGKPMENSKFEKSLLYDPKFTLNKYLNIQDPFDLKHNLTAKISPAHFKKILKTFRYSYERMYRQLMNNFVPLPQPQRMVETGSDDWGLNVLFKEITKEEQDK